MSEDEFRDTLDRSTTCPGCGTEIQLQRHQWQVTMYQPKEGCNRGSRRRRGAADWIGICFVKCPNCPWNKAAAAGSSDQAHEAAQAIRSQILKAIGK